MFRILFSRFKKTDRFSSCSMRRVLLILTLLLLAVASTGCKKAKLRSQQKELMAATIVLPDRITCIYNGEVYPMPDPLRDRAKLIVYIDSSGCTTCRISRIGQYHKLYQLSQEKGTFEVCLLLSNVDLNGIPVIRYLSDLEIEHPVYVDVDNEFLKLNPVVPEDCRMHAFLTDKSGHPLCVGDPAGSNKMLEVFQGALDKLT